jgi:hypothetical protein
LLAIHVFLLTITKFYDLQTTSLGTIACDNLGSLNKSKECCRKVPSNHKHPDILRSLRRVHVRLQGQLTYKHVYGHQDWRKTWRQMSLLEQLNCRCDSLAKKAIHLGIQNPPVDTPSHQRLPLEMAAVYITRIGSSAASEVTGFSFRPGGSRHVAFMSRHWAGSQLLSIVSIGKHGTSLFLRNLTCSTFGYSSSLRRSVPVGRIWADGLVLKSLAVPILAFNLTKMPRTYFIAPIRACSPCSERSSAV